MLASNDMYDNNFTGASYARYGQETINSFHSLSKVMENDHQEYSDDYSYYNIIMDKDNAPPFFVETIQNK